MEGRNKKIKADTNGFRINPKIKEYIIGSIATYSFHLIVANWSVLKNLITGTYVGGFVYFDFKLFVYNIIIY